MTRAISGRLIGVITVLLALPRPAIAQGAGISAVALAASHRLLGDPLTGGAAFLEFPRGGGRVTVRLGGELLRGSSRRTGSLCVGLIPPDGCTDEPLRDDARLTTFAGGLGARVLSRDRFAVKITGDLRLAVVESDTRGLTSGGRLSANESLWGADVGIEGAWSPWGATKPLALVAGVSVGGLLPVMLDAGTDGYTPFNTPFHFTRVGVGVAWRPRTR